MRIQKLFSSIAVFLFVCMFYTLPSQAQDGSSTLTPEPTIDITLTPTQIAVPSNDVAVLVVDAFIDPEPPKDGYQWKPGDACALTFDGLDGFSGRGNSIFSQLHALLKPHGEMVYEHFQRTLQANYGVSNPLITSLPNAPGVRYVKSWNVSNNDNVWLVGVDTNGYLIPLIVQRIEDAINSLISNKNVSRFVVNMSFGMVPCDKFPRPHEVDYAILFKELGVDCNGDSTGLSLLACKFTFEDSDLSEDLIKELVTFRDSNSANAIAFAYIQQTIMTQLTNRAFLIASQNPPILNFVQDISDFAASKGIELIQVASAGNDDAQDPYYPASGDKVVSVSANYPRSGACQVGTDADLIRFLSISQFNFTPAAITDFIKRLRNPTSNKAEIIDDGVSTLLPSDYLKLSSLPANADPSALGCVVGTSFAAPRISLQMAFHLLNGKGISCFDPLNGNFLSSPPLDHDHPLWDNLDISTAILQYCPGF